MADRDIVTRSGKGSALSSSDYDQNVKSLNGTVEEQTGTTYSVVYTDQGKTIELNNATMVCTLTAIATIHGQIDTDNFTVTLINTNAAAATVNRSSTDTFIGGATSLSLTQGQSVTLQTDSSGAIWNINSVKSEAPATANNLAMLDASGLLRDSLVETDGSGNITANVTGNTTGTHTGAVIADTVTAETTNGDLALDGNGTGIVTTDAISATTTDSNLVLTGNGTGFVVADFESGTFTPTIQDVSFSDAEGQTYSVQEGWYTRIGNRVYFNGDIAVTSLGTLTTTNSVYLAGLPYTSESNANNRPPVSISRATGFSLTAGVSVTGYVVNNNTRIILEQFSSTSGSIALLLSELTGSGSFSFQGQYITET